MVAKQLERTSSLIPSYLLAKIHMVAKLLTLASDFRGRYLLAKIHMVAKPQTDFIT